MDAWFPAWFSEFPTGLVFIVGMAIIFAIIDLSGRLIKKIKLRHLK